MLLWKSCFITQARSGLHTHIARYVWPYLTTLPGSRHLTIRRNQQDTSSHARIAKWFHYLEGKVSWAASSSEKRCQATAIAKERPWLLRGPEAASFLSIACSQPREGNRHTLRFVRMRYSWYRRQLWSISLRSIAMFHWQWRHHNNCKWKLQFEQAHSLRNYLDKINGLELSNIIKCLSIIGKNHILKKPGNPGFFNLWYYQCSFRTRQFVFGTG